MLATGHLLQGRLLIIVVHLDDITSRRRSDLPGTRCDAGTAKGRPGIIVPSTVISILLK